MAGQKGRSGRKKKPAAEKERAGTYRADRDADSVNFGAGDAGPHPPDNLHPDAAAEWSRLAPICKRRGLLTDGDWIAWRLGFAAYSTWLHASAQLDDVSRWVFATESGYESPSPFVVIAKNSWSAVLQFCREFGLTPSARSGLAITEPGSDTGGDPLEGLLN